VKVCRHNLETWQSSYSEQGQQFSQKSLVLKDIQAGKGNKSETD